MPRGAPFCPAAPPPLPRGASLCLAVGLKGLQVSERPEPLSDLKGLVVWQADVFEILAIGQLERVQIESLESRVEGRGSRVEGRGSRVMLVLAVAAAAAGRLAACPTSSWRSSMYFGFTFRSISNDRIVGAPPAGLAALEDFAFGGAGATGAGFGPALPFLGPPLVVVAG